MKVEIQLFGAFRDRVPGDRLSMELDAGTDVGALRQRLSTLLEDPLVLDSVLADESAVLGEKDLLLPGARLAILPPVCGG